MIISGLAVSLLLSGLSVESCARNYEKIGCYKEYHPQSEDLVVYDRFGIKWNDFDNYLHKYVSFPLHHDFFTNFLL